MSDPTERPEATPQGDGQASDETAGKVDATPAAERRAQEMDVDLASVEGTGSGGRVTAQDVENAQRQPDDSPQRSTETLGAGQTLLLSTQPTQDDIHRQYVVLKATLAGPEGGDVRLRFFKENGTLEDPITPSTFTDNPSSFFAPEPPIVKWTFPEPQAPIPTTLPGTNQPCRDDGCARFSTGIDRGVGRLLSTPSERRA
jgi:hypothetical protein